MSESLRIAALLQDSEAMREALRRELLPVTGTSLSVHGLSIDYFRQSPTRLVAQYSLDMEAQGGTRGVQIVTVSHFTDGRADKQWKRMRADAPDAEEPVGRFDLPGARYSSELQSVVQAFPFDARVPGLRKIVAGAPDVQRLVANGAADRIVSWQPEVVRYRPDMRAMARVDVVLEQDGRETRERVYVKAYREPEEGQRAYDLLEALAENATRPEGFQVPRPLAYDAELRILIISEATGVRLLDIVRDSDARQSPDAIRRAARAVAAMHGATLPASLLPDSSPAKDAQFAEVAHRLAGTFPDLASEVHALSDQLQAAFHATPLRPTHYDLKQGHILINPESVTILDFDKMAMGDPLIDVANLVSTLSAGRERSAGQAERRETLADLFVAEYFSHVPGDWASLFPAHLARATLLEAATTGRGNRGRKRTMHQEDRLVSAIRRAEELLAS